MKLPAIQVNALNVQVTSDATAMTEADAEQLQGDLQVRTAAFEEADKHLTRRWRSIGTHAGAALARARPGRAGSRRRHAGHPQRADLMAADDFASGYSRRSDLDLRHYDAAERRCSTPSTSAEASRSAITA